MTDDTIDMASLARFAILPGASQLMRAFSEIPPGPLRDSVIQHAQVIAATYTGAPVQHRMPDPITAFAPAQPQRITSRTGRAPKTESPTTTAVRMRLEDTPVADIATATGLSKQQVYQAIHEARKAGVKFPPRSKKPADTGTKVWHTDFDSLSGQGRSQVAIAARKRGIEPQDYLDRRQLALQLAQAGHGYSTILDRTGERDSKVVSAWLSHARSAGIGVPYVTFITPADAVTPEPEPEPVAEAVVVPVGRVFPDLKDMGHGAVAGMLQAAERRGMTLQAYMDTRESIVRHRMDGNGPSEIALKTGQTKQFVKDTIDAAAARGVQFPPLYSDDSPSVTLETRGAARETG